MLKQIPQKLRRTQNVFSKLFGNKMVMKHKKRKRSKLFLTKLLKKVIFYDYFLQKIASYCQFFQKIIFLDFLRFFQKITFYDFYDFFKNHLLWHFTIFYDFFKTNERASHWLSLEILRPQTFQRMFQKAA